MAGCIELKLRGISVLILEISLNYQILLFLWTEFKAFPY
jgi:hypothetical protein